MAGVGLINPDLGVRQFAPLTVSGSNNPPTASPNIDLGPEATSGSTAEATSPIAAPNSAIKSGPVAAPNSAIKSALVADPDPLVLSPAALSFRARPHKTMAPATWRSGLWDLLHANQTVSGVASWYPGTLGYGSSVHAAMPGYGYLPRGSSVDLKVKVCTDSKCLAIPVVDYCQCYVGTPDSRVIDLSWGALTALGLDPNRGIYAIKLSLIYDHRP